MDIDTNWINDYENEEKTMYDLSINQINEYTDFAKNKGILWANS